MDAVVTDTIHHARQCVQHLKDRSDPAAVGLAHWEKIGFSSLGKDQFANGSYTSK